MNSKGTSTVRLIQRQSIKDKLIKTASSDNRLFTHLPQEQEWCNLSPEGIREVMVKKISISPSLTGNIKPVHSEFALNPCSKEARGAILNAGSGFFFTGAKLEPATNWIPIIIPTVPRSIQMVQDQMKISSSMLSDEVERVCSIRPAHVKLYGRRYSTSPELQEYLKNENLWIPVKDATAITPQRIARGHLHVEIADQSTTHRIHAWLQLSVETVVVLIGPTVADVLHAQLVQVQLPRSS
ncbi:putative eka-like protein [Erysiphe necator]|uniref:Putative eka-like protein n=1 Tax=Uncinula necator TaxID=52586 RepID=A0A0B1P0I2_UNCNE|nr:putative eka-like protein [Erysiphe necator]